MAEDRKRNLVAVVACDGFLKLVVGHTFDLRGTPAENA